MGNVINGVSQTVHLSNSNRLSSRCEIMADFNERILEKKEYNTPSRDYIVFQHLIVYVILDYISQW